MRRRAAPEERRTLLITHAPELGGAELALLRLVEALPREERRRLLVACLAPGPVPDALGAIGVEVEVHELSARTRSLTRRDLLGPWSLLLAVTGSVATVYRLGRLASARASLVQSASMKAHVLSVPVALLSGRPLVWYLHDHLSRDYLPLPVWAVLQLLARVPDEVVVNSASTAATVPRRTTVIYPGFAPAQALDEDAAARHALPEPPVFTLLGRVSPTKGQSVFVRAAAQVHRHHPDCRFRIVGSPMFGQQDYADMVRLLGKQLDVLVEWVGFVADPRAEIDASTAVVHASPVPEPFGQVILEACVRGVPVIATEAGGAPEIIGTDGYLVPPGDVDALARAMIQVLDDPQGAIDRAGRAHRRALASFPAATTASQMVRVWNRVRGAGAAPVRSGEASPY